MTKRRGWAALVVALAGALGGCGGGGKAGGEAEKAPAAREVLAASDEEARAGLALVQKYECARCHEHDALPTPSLDKACVGCHAQITAGLFPPNEPMTQAKWAPVVA
ncbi:MAG TPA: hypothetical protein VFS00_28270, partial [Polyangiaceae bacterium]|nr:hypothetical protein [Polyangiaceae bacterium]